MNTIKKLAVLTSGGDAPGMNAAIRAVVRTAIYHELEVIGILKGYQGLIDDDCVSLTAKDVSNIIQRGGTILKTARCEAFRTKEGRTIAYQVLKKNEIDALVVIGGDGSFAGASTFTQEYNIPVIGIPATIDNDIAGTSYSIGFDTAVNTAIEAIDKIRDTASAHNRVFIVEVMGRDSGLIALQSGISCGAEDILVPEQITNFESILKQIDYDKRRNKYMRIIVVAEGDDFGGAEKLTQFIKEHFPKMDVKKAILGHIQRGGSPSHYDRWMASRFGFAAVKALLDGNSEKMTAWVGSQVTMVPFLNNFPKPKVKEDDLIMAKILSI